MTLPSDPSPDAQRVAAALDALRAALAEVQEAVAAVADSQRAFELATELAELLREAADESATLRARMVGRIWADEQLSLAQLAERISSSRTRAAQLLRAAKAAGEEC
jgi:hypothetical protein